jgi:cysteine sulfinate desulfinase/cysteine desulfurase-like protein
MRPYLEERFSNPSSTHWCGRKTHAAVKTARSQPATLLNCTPAEVLLTSGGIESTNHAIREEMSLERFMEEWARGTLRFSMGRMTSEEDIDAAGAVVADAAERLRSGRTQGEEGKR